MLTAKAAAAQSDISLQTSTGTLNGTLQLPSNTPSPVVLIIAGSGPTDRNGNSGLGLRSNCYAQLAAALARRGVASVRYDKRGIGASSAAASSEKDLRFETYIEDARAWLTLVHGDSRFSKIVVAGHSEGSLIGMVAALHGPAGAFVSLEGAGRPAATILREQLKRNLSPEQYQQSDAIISKLEQGVVVPDSP
ncbi:MAG: alpha/beta fold hydrolase [Candidatus Eremiobacteraeota bacterium]|nr:alpha/beta fold hydrolase [Candidatus Eremiobacteraeota bacterium]